MSPLLHTVLMICLAGLWVSAAMSLARLIIGPKVADRAVAFDTLVAVFIGVICILSVLWGSSLYFDSVWILTLVGFIGSVAVARYIEKGRVF